MQNTLRKVKTSKFDFSSEVPQDARLVISGLLSLDPKERMSLEEIKYSRYLVTDQKENYVNVNVNVNQFTFKTPREINENSDQKKNKQKKGNSTASTRESSGKQIRKKKLSSSPVAENSGLFVENQNIDNIENAREYAHKCNSSLENVFTRDCSIDHYLKPNSPLKLHLINDKENTRNSSERRSHMKSERSDGNDLNAILKLDDKSENSKNER